jgi:hypothetical protein
LKIVDEEDVKEKVLGVDEFSDIFGELDEMKR